MGNATRGRPRIEGERYPSGKLKPGAVTLIAVTAAGDAGARAPISGALWQRMIADGEKIFGDARFGTELTRLGALGQITSSEVATGIRVAGIYGRFEYYKNLKRSAASPHYIREYISEGAGSDTELINFTAKEGRERDRSFNVDDRELREADAAKAFNELQQALPHEFRSCVEALCVENVYVGYQGLIRARIGLAICKEHFADIEKGTKKDRKKKRRAAIAPAPAAKPASVNPFKDAFFKVQRALNPKLADADLENAWNVMCALKARADFRRDKAGANAAP
jgi:hypothetical protein